jgi:hypothetical protein
LSRFRRPACPHGTHAYSWDGQAYNFEGGSGAPVEKLDYEGRSYFRMDSLEISVDVLRAT